MIFGLASSLGYSKSNDALDAFYAAANSKALNDAFVERRNTANIINNVHAGKFAELVNQSLASRYHPETYDQMQLHHGIQTHNHLMNDIMDKVVVEWGVGARYWLLENGEEVADNAPFGRVTKCYDDMMRSIAGLAWLHGSVCAMPCTPFSESAGKRQLAVKLFTPEHFDLVPSEDNPADYSILVVYGMDEDERGAMVECKTMWSAEEWAEFRMGPRGTWMEVERGANPYGVIPAVVFRSAPSYGQLWATGHGKKLAEQTVEINCWETALSYQGGSQIKVLMGMFKDFPSGQYLRHGGAVTTGDAPASVADLQTNVEAFAKIYIGRLRAQAAMACGLQGDEFENMSAPPSGEALKMRYWQRDRESVMRRNRLRPQLEQLYWLTLQVLHVDMRMQEDDGRVIPVAGFEGEPGAVLPPYQEGMDYQDQPVKFGCDVAEMNYPRLAAEAQAEEDRALAMGWTNPAELYAEKNPDIPDVEDAIRVVSANRRITARLQGGRSGGGVTVMATKADAPPAKAPNAG